MSRAEQLAFQPETSHDNVIPIMGKGGKGGKGSRTPSPPDKAPLEESVEEPQAPSSTDRKRNVAWDAAVEVLGYEPKTYSEKNLWGKMTSSLNSAGATTEQIQAVGEWYHRQWPGIDLTITALEKWFSHFLAKAEQKARAKEAATVCPHCEVGGGQHSADCKGLN